MKIALGCDHAGYELSESVENHLVTLGHEVTRFGALSEERFDYPLASDGVACAILDGSQELGVLICGSGIGVSIRANRYDGIRAALCHSTETAELARQHNHANVLCLGARILSKDLALAILESFLNTEVDSGERHVKRVELLDGNKPC
ncbi:MAG: ribose 5-phosphate isomerase B [Armatimonadetes bacterium]|nr:ribose 5-phosphate isomerase B [Armatimonadota bacterium]